ncbi:hypothetical protein D3C79_1088360 [compost metagenome]
MSSQFCGTVSQASAKNMIPISTKIPGLTNSSLHMPRKLTPLATRSVGGNCTKNSMTKAKQAGSNDKANI